MYLYARHARLYSNQYKYGHMAVFSNEENVNLHRKWKGGQVGGGGSSLYIKYDHMPLCLCGQVCIRCASGLMDLIHGLEHMSI